MRFTMLMCGDMDIARQECQRRGFSVGEIFETDESGKLLVEVVFVSENDGVIAAREWLRECGEAPHPPGTLIGFRRNL